MRVIAEKDENPEIPTMKTSCTGLGFSDYRGCGRLLEFTPVDVFSGTSQDWTGGRDTYYYVICPICGAKNEIYYSKMTSEFKAHIH